ncbi:MAG: TldD/PmbA family protein [Thermoplasmata archaeon]
MGDYAGMAERIVNRAVKRGADDVVAGVNVNRSYQVRFAQNEPVISNRWRETGAFAGVVVQKRVVGTKIKDLSRVDETVDDLVATARKSQENPQYGGIAQGPFTYQQSPPDPKLLDLTDGGDLVYAAVNAALEEGAKETAGSFCKYDEETFLHTSNDAVGQERAGSLRLTIRAMVGPESSGHDVACATKASALHPEEAGRNAGKVAALAKAPKQGQPGTYDIVFEPLLVGGLVNEIGGRASAFAVLAGLSPFKDKLGEKVATEGVTIVDDGSADSLGARAFDGEGVPTRPNTVIDKGTLQTYLHNTSTAKLFETKTTGNARFIFPEMYTTDNAPPGFISPEPHALFIEPGDWTRDEMLAEVKDGLWLTNSWYTRYQSYMTGDFSTIPRDGIFRIQDGEVTEVWKDVRLTDNLLHLWSQVDGLGKEVQQVKWWYEVPTPSVVPHMLARDIGITRSAE